MERGLEPFTRHGKGGDPVTVKAKCVLNAIAEGRNIDLICAVIDGDLDISKIEHPLQLEKSGKGITKRYTIRGYVKIWHSEIRGKAGFRAVSFSSVANFEGTTFAGDANFSVANFKGYTSFNGANFSGSTSFIETVFGVKTDFIEATFSGNADFGGSAFSDQVNFNRAEFRGEAKFVESTFKDVTWFNEARFSGDTYFDSVVFGEHTFFSFVVFGKAASFSSTKFSGKADFSQADFSGNADFCAVTFNRDTDFRFTTFSESAGFIGVTFIEDAGFTGTAFKRMAWFTKAAFSRKANFAGAIMENPANFADVSFDENTVRAGRKNDILCPIVKWLTRGKVKLSKRPVTDFSGFNTTTMMDGSSNPYLKRYIDDEQWIESWRKKPKDRWWRVHLFRLWELTSHCGRSIRLWAFWSTAIALAFAFIYWLVFGCDSIAFNVDYLKGEQPGPLGYLYYSIVTFTTLGFGDIVPLTNWARLAVGAEVVLGYVMLGGLISIFANKFARRS